MVNLLGNEDIKQYIGLILWMSILQYPQIRNRWQGDLLYYSYQPKLMSSKKWKLITRVFNFTSEHKANDLIYNIRPFVNTLKSTFKSQKAIHEITIDEADLNIKGGMQLKEDDERGSNTKHELKVYLLCDTRTGYCHDFGLFAGEQDLNEEVEEI